MADGTLRVALLSELFVGSSAEGRLRERLARARDEGAELAVLPELPLHPWVPMTRDARDEDAEAPEGPRHRILAGAARESGVGLLGGAIVADPASGRRVNRGLLFDAGGRLIAAYDKLHVPSEEGFWEADHYGVGDEPPQPIDGFGLRVGIQLCSDLYRPEGSHLLGALGAEAILAPRATEATTWDRWRARIVANAVTSRAFVLSVNRPAPEGDVALGGPSIVVAPNGHALLETTDPLRVVSLERSRVEQAATEYPGYLPVRSELYARGWRIAAERAAEYADRPTDDEGA